MPDNKNIYASISDHVQMVGYRETVEELETVRPGTTIEVSEIIEDIKLPSPFGRIATDDIMEYMARFDKGIAILSEHTAILKQNTSLLYETNKRLEILEGMDNKLDTLPERIAEALKR